MAITLGRVHAIAVSLAPPLALIGFAWSMPACCCGAPPAPSPGPPGSISGHILFPAGTGPAALTVYAVNSDVSREFFTGYVMTRVAPPASTYELTVPPGDYSVVARLDGDPLSGAGYTQNLSCRNTSVCYHIPRLAGVRVDAKHSLTNIDVGDWGTLYAVGVLWNLDRFGSPMSVPNDAPPSAGASTPPTSLPYRELPAASQAALPAEHDLPAVNQSSTVGVRLYLPATWYQVRYPALAIDRAPFTHDFANQNAGSPLLLDATGVWLTVAENVGVCRLLTSATATTNARVITSQGTATFYFQDPIGPSGGQPFKGYGFAGMVQFQRGCINFIFLGVTTAARDSNLAVFEAIVQQAQYVDPY